MPSPPSAFIASSESASVHTTGDALRRQQRGLHYKIYNSSTIIITYLSICLSVGLSAYLSVYVYDLIFYHLIYPISCYHSVRSKAWHLQLRFSLRLVQWLVPKAGSLWGLWGLVPGKWYWRDWRVQIRDTEGNDDDDDDDDDDHVDS